MMLSKVTSNPRITQWIRQYDNLPSRDRLALRVLAIVVLALFLFFGVWTPASNFAKEAESFKLQQSDLLQYTVANKNQLAAMARQSKAQASVERLDSQALVSSVSSRAKRFGINLKRFEPSGDNRLKVWLEDAPFNNIIRWLVDLKSGLSIEVDQISIEEEDKPGLVSARITLSS